MSEDQVSINSSIGIVEKVKFLSRRENYPGHPKKIEVIETHMSWVFLADQFVYKLKKPVKFNSLDFIASEARHFYCKEEVRLNRRLTADTYLGVIDLTVDASGNLQLGGRGKVVDWLVKMKRLPKDRMLDYCLKHRNVNDCQAVEAAEMLAKFYQKSPPVTFDSNQYQSRLVQEIITIEKDLLLPEYKLPSELIKQAVARQLMFLNNHADLIERRVHDNRIIETHGDLRPEHICLTIPPVFMDCLEFSEALRIQDIAEELSFLAVECEMLGAPEIGLQFFTTYQEVSGDKIPAMLIDFFKSKRACYKARFTIWHLLEEKYRDDPKWTTRTTKYLLLAEKYAARLK
jgi:aminoglycoside phosphotransferase family enzyme